MGSKNLYLNDKVTKKAKEKAKKEARSLSAVVNRLLEMWIKGEVKL